MFVGGGAGSCTTEFHELKLDEHSRVTTVDPTIDELTKTHSLTPAEVKRLNGVLWRDSLDDPLGYRALGIVHVKDDHRFANWIKRVRASTPNKGEQT